MTSIITKLSSRKSLYISLNKKEDQVEQLKILVHKSLDRLEHAEKQMTSFREFFKNKEKIKKFDEKISDKKKKEHGKFLD